MMETCRGEALPWGDMRYKISRTGNFSLFGKSGSTIDLVGSALFNKWSECVTRMGTRRLMHLFRAGGSSPCAGWSDPSHLGCTPLSSGVRDAAAGSISQHRGNIRGEIMVMVTALSSNWLW